jgi:hypothetical protein
MFGEVDRHVGVAGDEMDLFLRVLLDRPGTQGDVHATRGSFRLAERTAADSLRDMELIGRDIADGEMAKVEIAHGPATGGLGGRELDSLTKERELVTKLTSARAWLRVLQIPGEIPPFRLEIRMGAVIAGKLPGPRSNGALPWVGRRRRRVSVKIHAQP